MRCPAVKTELRSEKKRAPGEPILQVLPIHQPLVVPVSAENSMSRRSGGCGRKLRQLSINSCARSILALDLVVRPSARGAQQSDLRGHGCESALLPLACRPTRNASFLIRNARSCRFTSKQTVRIGAVQFHRFRATFSEKTVGLTTTQENQGEFSKLPATRFPLKSR